MLNTNDTNDMKGAKAAEETAKAEVKGQPKGKAKAEQPKVEQPEAGRGSQTPSERKGAKAEKPEPRRGSYAELKVKPVAGAVAWVVVKKKGGDGQEKQSRCKIVGVERGQVKVHVTKTKEELTVSLERLFDHVPHRTKDGWK